MHRVEQSNRNKEYQHRECRHAARAMPHPPPRCQHVLVAPHIPDKGEHHHHQQVDERIGPENDGFEEHAHSSLILGSTSV